ncbi:MerR family transcriptional regulator [Candidatus Enterococcus mansonii]|uniref:HTH merR-type domain-containing protein n=1 Tax=Candidatus Enterococcus mansonii TaxID=1834181 RepID=A0A242CD99_9ENTE|nr:MerR family transcriptional regulator [Enterococcus sp. 4G2_DIV0659]OTO08215.1 hypothetical protein A5880_002485 [Enterococcus sp. 4G2_DIV0659]
MGKTVKEVAEILNVPKSTLRYYDKVNLVNPSRESNGYRMYQEVDLRIVKYILVMKYGEFNLEEIQTILKVMDTNTTAGCRERTELLIEKKKKFFQDKINYYEQMLALFEQVPEIKDFTREEESEIDSYIEKIYDLIVKNGEISR